MLKKFLLLLPMISLLTGCLQEPTDDQCITELDQLNDKNMPVTCASLDEFSQLNNVYEITNSNNQEFTPNRFITKEEALRKNTIQSQLNHQSQQHLNHKQKFTEIVSIEFVIGANLFLTIFLYMRNKEKSFKKGLATSSVVLSLLYFQIVLFYSNDFELLMNRSVQYVQNTVAKSGYKAVKVELDQRDLLINNTNKKEAFYDIESLNKINTCMNNNRRNLLKEEEQRLDKYDSKAEVLFLYNTKNDPFIGTIEESVKYNYLTGDSNVSKAGYNHIKPNDYLVEKSQDVSDISRKNIDYKISDDNGYPTISSISFYECGDITFTQKTVSSDLKDKLKIIRFKEELHKAVENNNINSGWEKIKTAYLSNSSDQLEIDKTTKIAQLLILYTYEFKKSIFVGSVLTGYDNSSEIVSSNFSNLKKRLEVSDTWYDRLNAGRCVFESEFFKKTTDEFEDFEEQGIMESYQCLSFSNNQMKLASDQQFNIIDEEDLIKDYTDEQRLQAEDIAVLMVDSLALEYDKVTSLFKKEIEDLFDVEETLVNIINRGAYASSDFYYKAFNRNNVYGKYYSELMNVSEMNYSKSLPNFSNLPLYERENISANLYNADYVDSFSIKTYNDTTFEKDTKSADIASSVLESSTMFGQSKYSSTMGALTSVFDLSTLKTDVIDTISQNLNNINKMTCMDTEEMSCIEKMNSFDGVSTWSNTSDNFAIASVEMLKKALIVKISSVFIETLNDKANSKRKGDTKDSGVQLGSNKNKVFSVIASGLDTLAYLMFMAGLIFAVLSNIMEIVFHIPFMITSYAKLMQIYMLWLLPFAFIGVIQIGFMTNNSIKDYQKTLVVIIEGILYSLWFATIIELMIMLTSFGLKFTLDTIQLISASFFESLNINETDHQIIVVIGKILSSFFLVFAVVFGTIHILKKAATIFERISTQFIKRGVSNSLEGISDPAKALGLISGYSYASKTRFKLKKLKGQKVLRLEKKMEAEKEAADKEAAEKEAADKEAATEKDKE